jgi:DNA-binding response OmpR family regulator
MPSVLVVDDERQIATIARDYLQRAGFTVTIAGDGAAGLDMARKKLPDLVVLDLGLPGMDGLQVARALRQESDVPSSCSRRAWTRATGCAASRLAPTTT